MENKIKDFADIKVGDLAVNNDTFEDLGLIVKKGGFKTMRAAGYISDFEAEEFEDFDSEELSELQFVLVKEEFYGNTLFMYDFDPCSAVVLENK